LVSWELPGNLLIAMKQPDNPQEAPRNPQETPKKPQETHRKPGKEIT
jgi:hypothetical protein